VGRSVTVAATVPFTTWLMKRFVDGVPAEAEEAAMSDVRGRHRDGSPAS
jgi:multiple sugar transport system permease protein